MLSSTAVWATRPARRSFSGNSVAISDFSNWKVQRHLFPNSGQRTLVEAWSRTTRTSSSTASAGSNSYAAKNSGPDTRVCSIPSRCRTRDP